MFNTVTELCLLRVVPTVDGADEIAGDATNTFEWLLLHLVIDIDFFAIKRQDNHFEIARIRSRLIDEILNICARFLLAYIVIGFYCYIVYSKLILHTLSHSLLNS